MTGTIGGMESGMTLGEQIATRRKALGISGSEAARRAGVHRLTWRAWEQNTSEPEDYNHDRIEKVLGWAPGSVVDARAGKQPTIAPEPSIRQELEWAEAELTTMPAAEFVARFRGAESVYILDGDRAGADRWLRHALVAREGAIHEHYREIIARLDAAKRDAS